LIPRRRAPEKMGHNRGTSIRHGAERLVVQHTQETGRTAAVLNTRLSFGIPGDKKNASLRSDECGKIIPCRLLHL
jgi:hypothetical protein